MIELLVVILVIAILITIVAGSYGWLVGRAKKTSTESFLNVIVTGLQNYSEKEGSIPMADWRNDEGVTVLTEALKEGYVEGKKGNFVKSKYTHKQVFSDMWNRPLRYRSAYDEDGNLRSPAPHNDKPDGFDLWSAGPDGEDAYDEADGDCDDIRNWVKD